MLKARKLSRGKEFGIFFLRRTSENEFKESNYKQVRVEQKELEKGKEQKRVLKLFGSDGRREND